MPLKILATADLHLGRKSSGVPLTDEASTHHTWNRLIDLAIQQQADILLLAGDIIDQDNRYYEAIGPLQSGFDRLEKNHVTVYLVTGNHDHDVLAQIMQQKSYKNIHHLGADGNWEKALYTGNDQTIQFVGWSFPKQHVRENPLKDFSRLSLDSNLTTIGLLHGEANNVESHYAPFELSDLTPTPVDTWILGHIHKPWVLHADQPYVAYPGSPHALDAGEKGPHGPLLMEVENKNDIRIQSLALSPTRYENLQVTIQASDDEAAVRDSITSALLNEGMRLEPELEHVSYLVFDVYLTGEHSSLQELVAWTNRLSEDYQQDLETGTRIRVRKLINQLQPAVENLEELAANPSPAGKLAETILAIQKNESTPFLDQLLEKWTTEYQRLNKSRTFQPLYTEKNRNHTNQQEARQAILQECRQLLGKLLNQQEQ